MLFHSTDNAAKLYGEIYYGNGQYISNQLTEFLKNKKTATVHLHTPGGSVFDGNLIYNTLRAFKGDLTIVIDGLAASMGTIIMLAANKLKIADNGLIMIHSPSGRVEGNAKDMEKYAKLLRTLEADFVAQYSKKTGKESKDIEAWLDGDNWFSSSLALSENIVDEIVDPALSDADISAFHNMEGIAACLENFASDEDLQARFFQEEEKPQTSTPKTNNNMKLNAKTIVALGLESEAKDNEISAAIENVIARNSALETKVEEMEKAQETAQAKAIESLIATAKKAGKITAKNEEQFTNLAKADFDLAKETIEALPSKENLTAMAGGGKPNIPNADGRDAWSFKDWKEKDYSGLLAMKEDDPERYAKVLKTSNL